eukprot:5845013-Amphidinium_carterae.1
MTKDQSCLARVERSSSSAKRRCRWSTQSDFFSALASDPMRTGSLMDRLIIASCFSYIFTSEDEAELWMVMVPAASLIPASEWMYA